MRIYMDNQQKVPDSFYDKVVESCDINLYNVKMLDSLYEGMIEYFAGDPGRIQHFIKVHSFARLIGHMEKLTDEELLILEAAAYVHDIGIKPAEQIYGDCSGKHQEELGPKEAAPLLEKCGFSIQQTERITYLVGHHHTYTDIDGADYRILVEADFLVNFYESTNPIESIQHTYETIFRTESGKHICKTMFALGNP